MADRNAPASFTFEEWRVEFNQLATDVGDIGNLPNVGGNNPTDIIEALTQLNSGITISGLLKRGICFRYIEEIFLDNSNFKNQKNKIGKGKINKWF